MEDFKNDDYIWNLLSPWIKRDNAVIERALSINFMLVLLRTGEIRMC